MLSGIIYYFVTPHIVLYAASTNQEKISETVYLFFILVLKGKFSGQKFRQEIQA